MKVLDGQALKQLFLSGANNLYNHYPEIDQLNVFPVPDGDTGLNMNLTLTSGCKEIENKSDNSCSYIAKSFYQGVFRGARGNSGSITSQIFRGFMEAVEGKDTIDVKTLSEAFSRGKERAYSAVGKPVEGTILTVIRESSAALREKASSFSNIEDALSYFLREAKKSLEHTPDLLPILKEVGVVDSGGAGLCVLIEGMNEAAHGHFIERNLDAAQPGTMTDFFKKEGYAGAQLSEEEEGYGYCTQFLLKIGTPEEGKKPFIEKRFENFLKSHGKSLVMSRNDDLVKVHVHTLSPGSMLNYAQNYGEFLTIIIENMSEEHNNIQQGRAATEMEHDMHEHRKRFKDEIEEEAVDESAPLNEFGLIVVSSGAGLDEMFKELGANQIVSGGQTMNPSVDDFTKAIKLCHAKHVYILPNNSNIVMAASQACDGYEGTETDARVVPSKTILQGLTSAMQFSPEGDPDSVYTDMKGALKTISSGSVTYAIKDADIGNIHITKDYYMGMKDDKTIVSCVKDKNEAAISLIEGMIKSDSYLVTIIYGKDTTEEEKDALEKEVTSRFPDLEVEVKSGGQPVYSYLIGVE